jgi:hypothetical protein
MTIKSSSEVCIGTREDAEVLEENGEIADIAVVVMDWRVERVDVYATIGVLLGEMTFEPISGMVVLEWEIQVVSVKVSDSNCVFAWKAP